MWGKQCDFGVAFLLVIMPGHICYGCLQTNDGRKNFTDFWPTVLSVVPLAHCVVCLSICRLSSVCEVLYCGETVRPSWKRLKEWIGNWGQKLILGSPLYFYFRFHRYGHRDGRFCFIFANTAQQSVLDGTNGLSSSNSCAYCRRVRSELKPEVVLATLIDPKRWK